MADTALKFGPEWMRALCDRGPHVTPNSPTPATLPQVKYKLAEHRYGREEMLALFDSSVKPPDELRRDNPNLMKDKCHPPLALIPMDEEEAHVWNTQVNSDVVLRLMNKERGGGTVGRIADSGRAPLSSDRGITDLRGGRLGGPPIRGVSSRPPGTSSSTRFPFGRSLEDDAETNDRKDFRGEFKRGISLNEDSGGPGRGFRATEPPDSKPRSRLDSRSNTDNWRKKPADSSSTTERESSWRGSARDEERRWPEKSGRAWRENDRNNDDGDDFRNGTRGSRYRNLDWDRSDGNLPEWCDDEPVGNALGTFDASGAFRSGSPEKDTPLEDDGEGEWHSVGRRQKRNSERESTANQREGDKERHHHAGHQTERDRHDYKHESRHQENQSKVMPNKGRISSPERNDNRDNRSKVDEYSVQTQNQNRIDDRSRGLLDQLRQPPLQSSHDDNRIKGPSNASGSASQPNRDEDETFGISIEKLTEHMVMKWTEEDEAKLEADLTRERQTEVKAAQQQQQQVSSNDSTVPTKWFYRDPQGEIQGPFASQEMLEWYSAGYFTMDLLVRRSFDDRFSGLGSLIKEWKKVPFAPGPEPPPIRQHEQQPQQQHSSVKMPGQGQQPQVIPQSGLQTTSMSPTPNELQVRQQQQQMLMLQQFQRQRQQQQHFAVQQQQQLQMQAQLRSLLEHLKTQPGFTDLTQQEQQQILLKKYAQLMEHRKMEAAQQQREDSSGRSIWELTNGGAMTSSALEEMQRREEQERRMEDMRKRLQEEEQRRRLEAERREEEERQKELQRRKQMEEEAMKMREEQLRKQQEEHEMRMKLQREEEERQQRLRDQEEVRKREEHRRRQEEMLRLEEMSRKQKEEEKRREAEEQHVRQQRQEMERQRLQQQEQEARIRHQAEAMRTLKGWGETSQKSSGNNALSLSEIQRLQEEKEREERLMQESLRKQQMHSLFSQQSRSANLTWGQSSSSSGVKTLAEIQREEAEKLARLKKEQEEKERERGQPVGNTGIWSNAASQLSWKGSSGGPAWGSNSGSQTPSKQSSSSTMTGVGFWESDHLSSVGSNSQTNSRNPGNQSKSSDALNKPSKPSANKNKKEEVG